MMTSQLIKEKRQERFSLFNDAPMNYRDTQILIVEDDDESRFLLKFFLEMWHYRVQVAKQGSQAVSMAETLRPQLILIDVRLPYLDGFETTRRIRASAIVKDVPIVLISGCAEPVYRHHARLLGANEYLIKPFVFDHLESTVGKYVAPLPHRFNQ